MYSGNFVRVFPLYFLDAPMNKTLNNKAENKPIINRYKWNTGTNRELIPYNTLTFNWQVLGPISQRCLPVSNFSC